MAGGIAACVVGASVIWARDGKRLHRPLPPLLPFPVVPPQVATYASTTGSVGNCSPAAAWESVVTEYPARYASVR